MHLCYILFLKMPQNHVVHSNSGVYVDFDNQFIDSNIGILNDEIQYYISESFLDSCLFVHFRSKYNMKWSQEVSRKLPGARGSVFPKYEAVASHGDPIHARICACVCVWDT